MPRLSIDLQPRPEIKIWKLIDAKIRQFRNAYPDLSHKLMSKGQEDVLRQHILNTIIVVSTICNVIKPIFNIWHSMIWMAGSPSFEVPGEHVPLSPPVTDPIETPANIRPERLPPTKLELSGHTAGTFNGRIESWRQHAEISDEPIERWNEILVGMVDVPQRLDLIERSNLRWRSRLWKIIEADKRENMLYPGRNSIPDIDLDDLDPTEMDHSSSEWESVSTCGCDDDPDAYEVYESLSKDDSGDDHENVSHSSSDSSSDASSDDDAVLTPEDDPVHDTYATSEDDARSTCGSLDLTHDEDYDGSLECDAHEGTADDTDSTSENFRERERIGTGVCR